MQVKEQLIERMTAQVEPQGWYLHAIQEDNIDTADSFYLGMYPEKKDELYAVFTMAFSNEECPGFLQCCKVFVWKDGRAQPLEWWGSGTIEKKENGGEAL